MSVEASGELVGSKPRLVNLSVRLFSVTIRTMFSGVLQGSALLRVVKHLADAARD
jgi:hypothetical protein